jgi:hypothetical protein
VTGSFASRTESGTSLRDYRNHSGNAAHRAIFQLLEEPVPALADPFPELDPLPGAYRLYLPSDGLTIWYTVTESPDGQVVIVVQYVKADT